MVLLDHDKTTGRISFRHYAISVAPSGVSRGVKTLVGRRALPSMGDMADVSEFLTKSGYGSVRSLSLRYETKVLWASEKLQGMLYACAREQGGEHRELTLPQDLGQRRHRAVYFLMKPARCSAGFAQERRRERRR